MNVRHLAICMALATLGAACEAPASAGPQDSTATAATAFPMRTCVNLGNALEAEVEGSWGYTIRQQDLSRIHAAGFDGVRLPVRWDPHTGPAPGYAVDRAWMERVAQVVDQSLAEGLMVQLDVHHFEGLVENPNSPVEEARFLAIWSQISQRFQGYDNRLMFELLNEPFGDNWTNARLEQLHAAALRIIRRTNPTRFVILGAIRWNTLDGLDGSDGQRGYRPPNDPHIALTFHSYSPYEFTHQGADWLGADAPQWHRRWGTNADLNALHWEGVRAAEASQRLGLAIQLGEFGVLNEISADQRLLWLRTMREAMDQRGVAWCVWDYAGAFNIYDRDRETWVPGTREALGLRR
jgi:endoglucanase